MFPETSIIRHFAQLEDPRDERHRKHPRINLITIAILGVLAGADTRVDLARYGNSKQEWLGTLLDLSNGIPSHDTFGRVFRWLDSEAFQMQFVSWTEPVCAIRRGTGEALDGKKLRRSQDGTHERDGIWMVSAWASENRRVLGQRKVDDKSNEITAIPLLLSAVDIRGGVVTVDALNTQTATAAAMLQQGADYLLPVKANQGTLHEDLQDLFDGFETENYRQVVYDTAKQVSEGHQRREIRQCWVVTQPEYRDYLRRAGDWSQLISLVKLMTVRILASKTSVAMHDFISSWRASARDFLPIIREHWQIENGLHWVLDSAFREDASRVRRDHAPQNLATLRQIALNLLKQEHSVKVGIAAKRKMAGWDNDYLFKVLCP